MKQCKITVFVEQLSIRIKRVRGRSLHITTTIFLCLSLAFFIMILGMFINNRDRKFLSSDEFYFPQLSAFYPKLPRPSYSYFLCNSSSAPSLRPFQLSNGSRGLRDWISPNELSRSMSDKELMWLASMVPNIEKYPYNRMRKVAFMFLSRGKLPLGPLWEKFFKGHAGLYSIYLHASPEFTEEPPESSVFYKCRIPSEQVEWGQATMVDAERRLLANALLDFSNERFVLLSETCIPLFKFTTIFNYLMVLINSNHSFVGSIDDPRKMGRGRYKKPMWPTISLSDWRKGNQWFEVHRKLAIEIVSDVTYYPIFENHCKPPCYMDEHYLATLVTKTQPSMNSNRSITWVDWSRGGSHPTKFERKDVSEAFLNRVRQGFNCTYNGITTTVCFLFARKFQPRTLEPLLRIAPVLLGFNP